TISDRDWSSDVCSSDLSVPGRTRWPVTGLQPAEDLLHREDLRSQGPHLVPERPVVGHDPKVPGPAVLLDQPDDLLVRAVVPVGRSEERRVGKEGSAWMG